MATLTNDQLMMMMMVVMLLAIVAASIEPPDGPQVNRMVEAVVNNGTMLGLLVVEERNGDDHLERPQTKCLMADPNSDLQCTYMCLPYLGTCKKPSLHSVAVCACEEKLYEETVCHRDDQCEAKLEVGKRCKCMANQCHCEIHTGKKDFSLLSEASLAYASQKYCTNFGNIKLQVCPNNMIAVCLFITDQYKCHCMINSETHRGFMTLADANRIYVPVPSNQRLMTRALYLHSVCAQMTICPQTQIGYLRSSRFEDPFCACVHLDGRPTIGLQTKIPVPCKVDGKLENPEACKKTCKKMKQGHCDLAKGEPATDCHCTNTFQYVFTKCVQAIRAKIPHL